MHFCVVTPLHQKRLKERSFIRRPLAPRFALLLFQEFASDLMVSLNLCAGRKEDARKVPVFASEKPLRFFNTST